MYEKYGTDKNGTGKDATGKMSPYLTQLDLTFTNVNACTVSNFPSNGKKKMAYFPVPFIPVPFPGAIISYIRESH